VLNQPSASIALAVRSGAPVIARANDIGAADMEFADIARGKRSRRRGSRLC